MKKYLIKNISTASLEFVVKDNNEDVLMSLKPGESGYADVFISSSMRIFERKNLISFLEEDYINSPEEEAELEEEYPIEFKEEEKFEIESNSNINSDELIEKKEKNYKGKKRGRKKKRGPKPGNKKKDNNKITDK